MPSNYDHRANLIRCNKLATLPIKPPPKGEAVRSLRVVLAANRAMVQSVRLGEQVMAPEAEFQREFTFHFSDPKAVAEEAPQLQVDWRGEPPVVIQAQWNPPPDDEAGDESRDEAEEVMARLSPRTVYANRQQQIKRIEDEERAARTGSTSRASQSMPSQSVDLQSEERARFMQFFHDLDFGTLPALLKARKRRLMQALTYLLRVRLKQRGRARIGGSKFVPEDPPVRQIRYAVDISRQLCELFEDRFGDLQDDGNLAVFDRTFERFVCGDLAVVPHGEENPLQSHGAPNGINYLLFAEFALLALTIESDAERHPIWRRVLPTFVRTAEMFLELYWNGGCRTYASYGFAWLERGFSHAKCQRLRESYREVAQAGSEALAERFGLLCSHALRDDIGREVHLQ
ncbi:MAG: hypothetical protein NXI31_01770 [bacterium]|nr:hypothetical protein [bacterium]